ncbi:MAG: HAD hydrolase-like protein [Pseudomonadota bacterium]
MTVFLDLDGTLTDPKEGIVGSITKALRTLELPVPEDLTWAIGPPLVDSFEKLGAPDPLHALEIYRADYGDGGLLRATVYPGIADALSRLTEHRTLFLATAKPHVYATQITAHFDLDQFLTKQFGPELDGTRNDKGDLLRYACDQLSLDPGLCVMVGDRAMDMAAARANRMPFIGVTWGYARDAELEGADALCTKPTDLADLVLSLSAE